MWALLKHLSTQMSGGISSNKFKCAKRVFNLWYVNISNVYVEQMTSGVPTLCTGEIGGNALVS